MLTITTTPEWLQAHPGAAIGLLELSGGRNQDPGERLQARKHAVEISLRQRYQGFTRADFLALPVMAAYQHYYKRFQKTYHVLLQVESLVLKGRPLPDVLPLVDANFIAEVGSLVLTAGHDAARLRGPILLDVSREEDAMTQMDGTSRTIRAGDMVMRDSAGICCSIIYGQDDRSPISAETSHVLYVAYAPAGVPVETVESQLQGIEDNIRLFSPDAVVEQSVILSA
jgi:DNA/RNA-binding domain of Phe-tRNA-synthetase-like protein